MITITKLNGKQLVINCEMIETIEALPDTTITMQNGKKFIATETIDEVIERIVKYKNDIFNKFK